jgi:Zn-dependent peptidase ImmA (M78 family)/DNA-binding XRE family transcriptional regulator
MTASARRSELPVNPRVLRWARERLRLAPEDVARKIAVNRERIIAWENEDRASAPTVRQARKLADVYDRPFLEFFAPSIPELDPPALAPDYRFHRYPPSDLELTVLEGVQAWAESQRLNALDLYQELGETPPQINRNIHAEIDDDPEDIAAKVRHVIGPTVTQQFSLKSKDRYKFPTVIRNLLERAGILVLKQSDISKVRTRGICLYDRIMPIIVFGNESPGAQAFTLAHELGHVVLGASAISGGPRSIGVKGTAGKRIEAWCNSFAAAFLMPRDAVMYQDATPKTIVSVINDRDLTRLANRFAVSRHAMLIRLVNLGKVHSAFYWRVKRPEFLNEEEDYEGGGRSLYYGSRYRNTLGDTYTGLVIEAHETGKIGALAAAEFMGIKNVQHFIDIKNNFAK